MGASELDASLRVLERHQWVRDHGTPRVTALVGRGESGRQVWAAWAQRAGRIVDEDAVFAEPAGGGEGWLSTAAAQALARATSEPREPVVLIVEPDAMARWLKTRADRLAVFVAEGIVELDEPVAVPVRPLVPGSARSRPEQLMFDALDAVPATAGQFQLNQPLSFHFGGRAVEVDLLARGHELVIEIDGYHHFTDVAHYRRDREKDLMIQAHGYGVLRFHADDVVADARALAQAVVRFIGIKAGARRREKG